MFSCTSVNEKDHIHTGDCCHNHDGLTRSNDRCVYCKGIGNGLEFGEKCKHCGNIVKDYGHFLELWNEYVKDVYGEGGSGGGGGTTPRPTFCQTCNSPSGYCVCFYVPICNICGKKCWGNCDEEGSNPGTGGNGGNGGTGGIFGGDSAVNVISDCGSSCVLKGHSTHKCIVCERVSCETLWQYNMCPSCGSINQIQN